jgi:hypothetical protein
MCIYALSMYECSLIVRERVKQSALNLACLLFDKGKRYKKGKTPKNIVLSSSRCDSPSCSSLTKNDRRMAPAHSCLFRRGDYRNEVHKHKISGLGLSPAADAFVAWKLSTIKEQRQGQL